MSPDSRCKRMVLLNRRDDLDRASFVEHWAGPHAAIAKQLPGVCGYVQNRVTECLWSDRGPQADGIVELWFSNTLSIAEAAQSDIGKLEIPQDERRFLSGITLANVDSEACEESENLPGQAKVMIVSAGDSALPLEHLGSSPYAAWSALALSTVKQSYARPPLLFQPGLSSFAAFWFRSADEARRCLAAMAADSRLSPYFLRTSAFLVDPLRIV